MRTRGKSCVFVGVILLALGFSGCGGGGSISVPPSPFSLSKWTWEGGSNRVSQTGTYGTLGTAAPGNIPGARAGAVTWIDASGNRWLFGGSGLASAVGGTYLNDLWKYSGGQWTWMGGANVNDQKGTYGTLGVPDPTNIPGARTQGAAWSDAAGDGWLFGGVGWDSAGTPGQLNDLWKYSGGNWTWIGGSNTVNQAGTYGALGIPSPGNNPGARADAVFWTDGSGTLWLFGGQGNDSTGTYGLFNDLWKYGGGQWTWMSGSDVRALAGTYGTQGTPAPNNVPGGRAGAAGWVDGSGDFWLFGGAGYDSAANGTYLNDLWRYSAGQWTWMGGSKIGNQRGTYGTQGTPAPGNVPGGRSRAVGWTDASGNFWLFGGAGYDSAGNLKDLNDLWKYSAGEWTWMAGADVGNQAGIYGTLGVRGPGNVPGARNLAVAWTDKSGNFLLFGGSGRFNDLWSYQP
jgi:N-acetylneuraminic acid mutarotase